MARPKHDEFNDFHLDPTETRALLRIRMEDSSRIPNEKSVHRAHEYIQKIALESVRRFIAKSMIGETKSDDIPADIRMERLSSYLKHYFPEDRARL